jgi:mannosyltransferase
VYPLSRQLSGILAGAVLILPGLLLSAPQLVSLLHGPDDNLAPLLLGAQLFRGALVVTGLYLVLLGFLPAATPAPLVTPPRTRYALPVLLVLVAIAAALRLYRLDAGIWLDEMLAWVNYMSLGPGRIFTTFDDPNNHLLYTLLARLSFALYGDSTGALRLPAVLFGVASIPALYCFARQVSSPLEALFSAALFTFSYHHIWFSQDARGYTALLFFTLLSSTLLIRALRSDRRSDWVQYALAAALGAFTHLTMGFVVTGQFAVYLVTVLRRRHASAPERWAGLLGGFIPVGLLTCLAYAFVLPQMLGGGMESGTQGTVAAWTSPVWMALELLKGLRISFAGGAVVVLALLVFSIGLLDFLRRQPVVPALLLIPAGLGFLVMVSIHYTLFPRFFFFAMGFAVVVVIRGCRLSGAAIGRWLHLPGAAGGWPGYAVCTALVAVSMLSVPFAYGPKQDYQSALDLVDRQRLPGDAVVTLGAATIPFQRFYRTGWDRVENLAQLDAIMAQHPHTWVVYTMPMHTEAAFPEISARLRSDFRELGRFPGTLNGGAVVVCRSAP